MLNHTSDLRHPAQPKVLTGGCAATLLHLCSALHAGTKRCTGASLLPWKPRRAPRGRCSRALVGRPAGAAKMGVSAICMGATWLLLNVQVSDFCRGRFRRNGDGSVPIGPPPSSTRALRPGRGLLSSRPDPSRLTAAALRAPGELRGDDARGCWAGAQTTRARGARSLRRCSLKEPIGAGAGHADISR